MPRELAVGALGSTIRIDGSALTDRAWATVRAAWHDAAADTAPGEVPSASVAAHAGLSDQSMLSGLSVDVTLAAIRARAGELLMLHAAGLADERGRVIALVGPSGKGKTTAARLLGGDFAYVSDETVGITRDGLVVSHRKPLSLIENDRLPKVQRSPSELRLRPLPKVPLLLTGLALLDRNPDADEPVLESVDASEGIVRVVEQASYLGKMPAPLQTLVALFNAIGGVHRLTYRDAATVAPLIRKLFGRAPSDVAVLANATETVFDLNVPERSVDLSRGSRYLRAPVLDATSVDAGRLVLLIRDHVGSTRVIVLDGIAPALWLRASTPASLGALTQVAVQAHGDPLGADAAALVSAKVNELADAGVFVRV